MSMTLRKDDIRVSTFTLLHFKTETLDNFALTLLAVTTRKSRTSTVEYVCTLLLSVYRNIFIFALAGISQDNELSGIFTQEVRQLRCFSHSKTF